MLELKMPADDLAIEWILRLPDETADKLLVAFVSSKMTAKLEEKRKAGRHGWYGAGIRNQDLEAHLVAHISKGDMVDVINIAGMILAREALYGETA